MLGGGNGAAAADTEPDFLDERLTLVTDGKEWGEGGGNEG